jgi:AcrR family transcriptional regulator
MDAAASPSDVPAVRRAAILRAAGPLFAERGFRAVGMAEIGESAGMSAASLYRFFSGKGAILAVLWDEALSEVTEAAAAAADSAASADERLELILRAHASLLVRKYAHVGNLVRRGTAGLPKADREALSEKERIYLRLWADQLHELLSASDGEIFTRIFTGLAILHSVAVSDPQYQEDVLIEELVCMTKAGMLATVALGGSDRG